MVDIVVDLRFYQVVGDIVDGVVVAGVLVIYKHEMVGALLDEDVVGQQVVVREHKCVLFVLLGELVDELHFLLAHPLLEQRQNGLFFGQEDVLAHFLVAEVEDAVHAVDKASPEERLLLDLVRGGLELVELAQREGHFLQIARRKHHTGGKNGRFDKLLKSDLLIIVVHLWPESLVSHMHVHEDL